MILYVLVSCAAVSGFCLGYVWHPIISGWRSARKAKKLNGG